MERGFIELSSYSYHRVLRLARTCAYAPPAYSALYRNFGRTSVGFIPKCSLPQSHSASMIGISFSPSAFSE
jgi:hypothetical protein